MNYALIDKHIGKQQTNISNSVAKIDVFRIREGATQLLFSEMIASGNSEAIPLVLRAGDYLEIYYNQVLAYKHFFKAKKD